ncbi:MAG: thiamine diphosphokinase [Fusobacteriaceae bacterium]
MKGKIAYVFLNGEIEGSLSFFRRHMEKNPGDIYCADGGYSHCEVLEKEPLEIWGDMDSVDSFKLKNIQEKGVVLRMFSKDKNFTDGELLLEHLYSECYEKIYIIGGLGGDRAHELTNLNLIMKYPNLIFITEKETIFSVEKQCVIEGRKDSEISFIPMSEKVKNLTLRGFRYPLKDYSLKKWESICMSNVIEENSCSVTFDRGVLLGILKNR